MSQWNSTYSPKVLIVFQWHPLIDSKFSIAFLPPSLPPPPPSILHSVRMLTQTGVSCPVFTLIFPLWREGKRGDDRKREKEKEMGRGGGKTERRTTSTRCLGKWRVTYQTLTVWHKKKSCKLYFQVEIYHRHWKVYKFYLSTYLRIF